LGCGLVPAPKTIAVFDIVRNARFYDSENREFGGEYFVWAKKVQISKKYFRIFQKSLVDISEIEISFPTYQALSSHVQREKASCMWLEQDANQNRRRLLLVC
jgi:hypothetical protein